MSYPPRPILSRFLPVFVGLCAVPYVLASKTQKRLPSDESGLQQTTYKSCALYWFPGLPITGFQHDSVHLDPPYMQSIP